jgi:cytochrome c oxidase assembly protein subunit 15
MKKLVLVSIFLTIVVIILGAYTRLTDAGLGCPDWPGCYGQIVVPQTEALIEAANLAFPDRPVESEKAWNEMIHRYFASALGVLILIIFVVALSSRKQGKSRPVKLPFLLLVLVCFQGALGYFTVSLNLSPAVVMGHLLGGFSVLSGLFILYLRLNNFRIPGGDPNIRRLAKFGVLGIILLVGQIALGGWTSANYASLACTELPICQGNWTEKLDVGGAFSVPTAENYEFGAHSYEERMTIHITHRFGAIIVILYLCWLAVALYQKADSGIVKRMATLMVIVLGVQIGLGISNVVYALPLIVATMHNAVAACLLLVMILLTYTMYRKY